MKSRFAFFGQPGIPGMQFLLHCYKEFDSHSANLSLTRIWLLFWFAEIEPSAEVKRHAWEGIRLHIPLIREVVKVNPPRNT